MKDLNGKEIDFADEKIFPLEYMMPKKNHEAVAKIQRNHEQISEDEEAEGLAEFMHSMDTVLG